MSNSTELHDREYVVPLCVLNAFFALTAVVLNSVTIHAIRKTSSASLSKNLRALLLNLALSDLSVGLVVQPIYIIRLTQFPFESQQGDLSQKMKTAVATGTVFVLILSVDRFLAVYLHLRSSVRRALYIYLLLLGCHLPKIFTKLATMRSGEIIASVYDNAYVCKLLFEPVDLLLEVEALSTHYPIDTATNVCQGHSSTSSGAS